MHSAAADLGLHSLLRLYEWQWDINVPYDMWTQQKLRLASIVTSQLDFKKALAPWLFTEHLLKDFDQTADVQTDLICCWAVYHLLGRQFTIKVKLYFL